MLDNDSLLPDVFVNRTLSMKKIRYIGLDMDHTLVRYHSKAFNELAHQAVIHKLITQKGYPAALADLRPDFDLVIQGLVLDKKKGNLLKINKRGWIYKCSHGTTQIDFFTRKEIYKSVYIDLAESDKYYPIDTAFAIPTATLFAQLVDLKDSLPSSMPSYEQIVADILELLDQAHADDTLKSEVVKSLEKYIIADPQVVRGLERHIKHGKKLFIATNSGYAYTKSLLDYTINPFLTICRDWTELFEFVIVDAKKPEFFYENRPFFQIVDGVEGCNPYEGKLLSGIYKGGNAMEFTADLGIEEDEILYIGDHIYSDILRLKKSVAWRTALVLEDFAKELETYFQAKPYIKQIHLLMREKEPLEKEVVDLISEKIETGHMSDEKRLEMLSEQVQQLNMQLAVLIAKSESLFNLHWGEIMRAGNEESYLAYQTERYACIYMSSLANLLEQSPRTYYRAFRRPMVYELMLQLDS